MAPEEHTGGRGRRAEEPERSAGSGDRPAGRGGAAGPDREGSAPRAPGDPPRDAPPGGPPGGRRGRRGDAPGPFSLTAILTAVAVVAVAAAVVLFAAYHTCAFEGCPPIEQVSGFVPEEASVVLDADGEEVSKLFRVNRVVIGLDSLPEHVSQAFIAVEDQEFYEHGGVDLSRVVGAAWQNVRSGGIQEGFSTISMQVARNLFPDQLPVRERTLNRKISEIKVARQLEARYPKDRILELYLNQIYFGSGAWGIESASREYFGKAATELSVAEAALLAGLPQAPSRLNPRENREGALERRETVLRRMHEQRYITDEELAAAREEEPQLARSRDGDSDRASYFLEHVRRFLEDRLGDRIYTGGYRIHTTLDVDLQERVEREMEEQLRAIEAGRYGGFPHPTYAATVADGGRTPGRVTPYLQGAVLVMSARTGDVLALVGGRDFRDSRYNRATQARRQPGSAFKPVVYAAAIGSGYPPNMVLEDTPYRLARDGRVWEPRNYDGSYSGDITMRQALVNSKNVATIRLADQVGLSRVISLARDLGFSGDIPPYPSIAIGSAEVTLEEMVAAYAAFATLGDRPEPRYVTRVTDREGRTVFEMPRRSRRALSPDAAFVTVDLMRDVVDRGTGTAVRAVGFGGPAAGKTGTTNESADVWFVGFTPEVVAGVWIGMDDPQRIMPRATGGRLAAPVWGRVMRGVGSGGDWSPPPGVEQYMVDEFGNVLASNCPTYGDVRSEYFVRGTVFAGDCRGYGSPWDTLYGDSLYGVDDEDTWWRRLRERFFGDEDPDDPGRATPPDTIILLDPPTEPGDPNDPAQEPFDPDEEPEPGDEDPPAEPPEPAGEPVPGTPPDTPPDTSPAGPPLGEPAGGLR